MRIAINTLPLLDNIAGAERYTLNIIRDIAKLNNASTFVMFLSKINHKYYGIERDNFANYIYNANTRFSPLRILGEQVWIPYTCNKLNVDIFFSPCNIAPLFVKAPTVITLFDLHWLIYPEMFGKVKLLYLKNAIRYSIARARKVITISDNSKKDIIKIFGVPGDKIKVIPCGLDPIFKMVKENERLTEVRAKFDIRGKFIFFAAQLHRRKNVIRLLEAYNKLKKERNIEYMLVIAGGKGDGYDDMCHYLSSNGLEGSVKLCGCVSNEELLLLYNSADLFVYPSIYEGFGLPVIEAMACGTPVVTSNVSSLPEVAGDAAVLVDPYNVDDIANAIYNVINDNELRESLIDKGLKRAKEFSWEKAAKETLEVFEEVYNETKLIGKG